MPTVARIYDNVSLQWKTTTEKEVGVLVLAKMEKQGPGLPFYQKHPKKWTEYGKQLFSGEPMSALERQ